LENLEEINEFVGVHDVPKLKQEDINNLSRSIMTKEIETVIVYQQKRFQDQMGSQPNSTIPLKKGRKTTKLIL
jgi:hypothetical protein